MKKLEEMTREELVKLNEEEIDRIINLKLAEASLPLLGHAPTAPEQPKVAPDKTVYYIEDLVFEKIEDAIKVKDIAAKMDLINYKYLSGPGYNRTCVKREYPLNVASTSVYSEPYWNKIKDIKIKYDKEKAEYDREKTNYDKVNKERESIITEVWSAVDDALTEQRTINIYRKKFEEYLKLAEGNRAMAFKFLNSTYPDVADFPFLVDEFMGGNDSEGSVVCQSIS